MVYKYELIFALQLLSYNKIFLDENLSNLGMTILLDVQDLHKIGIHQFVP
jgi:hypothetical protein